MGLPYGDQSEHVWPPLKALNKSVKQMAEGPWQDRISDNVRKPSFSSAASIAATEAMERF